MAAEEQGDQAVVVQVVVDDASEAPSTRRP
jgi:hypothetical protein